MYRINDNLATHGIGENYYPMPEEHLLTGYPLMEDKEWEIVDVRDLLDGSGNKEADYSFKIHQVVVRLIAGKKVVVCCGAGQSRSNAIAVGALVRHNNMDFYDAMELVRKNVPIAQIDPSHVSALKNIFKVGLP